MFRSLDGLLPQRGVEGPWPEFPQGRHTHNHPLGSAPEAQRRPSRGFQDRPMRRRRRNRAQPLMLHERRLARPVLTQTYQAPYNQEHCCFFGIKRALVESHPNRDALILCAFHYARQWTAQNPSKAVVATQTAGYMLPRSLSSPPPMRDQPRLRPPSRSGGSGGPVVRRSHRGKCHQD